MTRGVPLCFMDLRKKVLVQTSELAWAATMTGMPARQRTPELFKGLHFDHEVVILCVRWYLSYKLSSRDLVNMMGERSVEVAHTTILRWVQRYVPEFEKRWNRYARTVGGSWRCDETYIEFLTGARFRSRLTNCLSSSAGSLGSCTEKVPA